jgi:Zn-dependent protease with chaperone function
MDFFQHQERARRNSGRLVLLFGLAVVAIVVLTYLVTSAILIHSGAEEAFGTGRGPAWFDPLRLLLVGGGVVAVVALGSLYKTAQLARGGGAVAEMLGGRRLEPGSADPLERRLLNVVEELALAAGLPVPPVYLLEGEEGINAFAAGHRPGDAVLGFTRGAVEKLSRSELQGVVGHEFSHVLHGDMRLNLRLIGVLHGILLIGLIGQYVLRTVRYAPGRSRNNTGSATAIALGLGATFAVLGAVGTFFGRLIQAAVSRQREFLADAAAVQFTRDPSGIAGALRKIGGYPSGSRVRERHAPEVAHMLFEEHGARALGGMLATHPPLPERIARLDPSFRGQLAALAEPGEPELRAARAAAAAENERPRAAATGSAALAAEQTSPAPRGATAPEFGTLDAQAAAYARTLLDALPRAVLSAADSPFDARAVVLGLALGSDPVARAAQLAELARGGDAPLAERTAALAPALSRLGASLRLPLLDRCLPALRQLSPDQYRTFAASLDRTIELDQRVELFEACLRRIVRHHLDRQFDPRPPRREAELRLSQASGRLGLVLGWLARSGHRGQPAAEQAFAAAAEVLGLDPRLPGLSSTLQDFDRALDDLSRLRPEDKRAVLAAARRAVIRDGQVTAAEAEVFRALGEALDCPVPPLWSGQTVDLSAARRGSAP